MIHSICAMQENQHKSVEEIRFEAYAKAGEPALLGTSPGGSFGHPAGGAAPFGASASSAFGAGTTPGGVLFGAAAPSSTLGGPGGGSFAPSAVSSIPFGATTSTFGASPGGSNPFGAATPGGAGVFGAAAPGSTGAFGASALQVGGSLFGGGAATAGFRAPTNTPAFGSGTPSSAFGGSPVVAGGGLFGTSPTTNAFGGATLGPANPFGAASTPGYGAAASTLAFGAVASIPAFGGAGTFGAQASMPAFGGSLLGGAGAFSALAPTPAFSAAASTPAFGGVGAFGAPGSTLAFGASASTPTVGVGASTPAFSSSPAMPALSASAAGVANPFGAPGAAPVSAHFGAVVTPLANASSFGAAATGGGLFGSTAPSAVSNAAPGAVAASTPAFGVFAATPGASPGLFSATGVSTGGTGLSLTPAGSIPAFSFAPASTAAACSGLFGAAARPLANPAFDTALASTSLFGGAAATSPGLGATMTPSLFGAPPMTGVIGGGLGTTSGLSGGTWGVAPLGIAVVAAPPGVNASPYGDLLAMPVPMASPATSSPPLQKMSLLGGGSPSNIHVAFPVRTLTPRPPWLSSRGGLTPRMKPRGKSTSPSPGGGDTGDCSSRTAASLGGDGGSPLQMATAGNWIFKPRESPRNLFIRPEPAAPSSLASLVAISLANSAYLSGSGSDADGGSSGYQGSVGKHCGTPERRHVHFEDEVADESPSPARKTTDGGRIISGVKGSATTQDVLPVISTQDEGYLMEPSQEVMRMLLEEKGDQVLASMEDFIVTRENFGSVKWLEPVDIRNLEID